MHPAKSVTWQPKVLVISAPSPADQHVTTFNQDLRAEGPSTPTAPRRPRPPPNVHTPLLRRPHSPRIASLRRQRRQRPSDAVVTGVCLGALTGLGLLVLAADVRRDGAYPFTFPMAVAVLVGCAALGGFVGLLADGDGVEAENATAENFV